MIQTVLGKVAASDLGGVLIHEHLNAGTCWLRQARRGVAPDDPVAILAAELSELKAGGIQTVVEVSTPGTAPRDLELLCRVSERSEVHIIAGTGFYKEPLLPAFVHEAEIDAIAEHLVRELTVGADGTQVKAGIIGEVGSSLNRITAAEEKLLRAAARAHRATGAPITTHTTLATMGPEQVAILESEGVAPAKIIVGHCDLSGDPDYLERVARTGAWVAFDTIGKQRFFYMRPESMGQGPHHAVIESYFIPDQQRLRMAHHLIQGGWGGQLLFSSDIHLDRWVYENWETLGQWGYRYVTERFCPDLKRLGAPAEALTAALLTNPARLFS